MKWYSFAYLISFFIINFLVKKSVKSQQEDLNPLSVIVFISGICGARLWHYALKIVEHGCSEASLADLVDISKGGLAIQGGLVGGFIAALLYARMKKIPLGPISDQVARFLPIGLFLGRLGNFANREFMSHSFFGLPVCIFSALTEGLLLGALTNLFRKKRTWHTTYIFIGFYGLIRAFNDIMREEYAPFFGIKFSQYFCLLCLIIAARGLSRR